MPTPKQEGTLVEVSDATFPLVVMRVPVALEGPAIQSMFDGMDRVLKRESRFALIVDTRALKGFPNAVDRGKIAEWMKARNMAEARYNLGNAVVLSSTVARAMLTAIEWVRRPITAHTYTGSLLEAIDWCSEKLKGASIPLPPSVSALRETERVRRMAS
jgi:hypothetical protein